jgi:hypothetical protein
MYVEITAYSEVASRKRRTEFNFDSEGLLESRQDGFPRPTIEASSHKFNELPAFNDRAAKYLFIKASAIYSVFHINLLRIKTLQHD